MLISIELLEEKSGHLMLIMGLCKCTQGQTAVGAEGGDPERHV